MTQHSHAVVWIDHREARVLHFSASDAEQAIVRPHNPAKQVHHKANSIGSGRAHEDQDFYHRTAQAIADAQAVLVTGPANAKHELVKHIRKHDPEIGGSIAGVETLDHPTDVELLSFARHYFRSRDRMTPQMPAR